MKAAEEMSELRDAIEAAGASPTLTHCTLLAVELSSRIQRMEKALEDTLDLSAGWDKDGSTGPRSPLSWESVGRCALDYAQHGLSVPEYPQPRSFRGHGCDHCDSPGGAKTYANQACLPINGRVVCVDWCLHHIVAALNAGGVRTVASCCGHGQTPGRIDLEDGRTLTISGLNTAVRHGAQAPLSGPTG